MRTPLKKKFSPAGACRRKQHFSTWAHAERIAAKTTAYSGRLIMAYRCSACGRWANGSVPRFCLSPVGDFAVRREGMLQLADGLKDYDSRSFSRGRGDYGLWRALMDEVQMGRDVGI
jgi:hypothetical protein